MEQLPPPYLIQTVPSIGQTIDQPTVTLCDDADFLMI
jgi:hypothetical protein